MLMKKRIFFFEGVSFVKSELFINVDNRNFGLRKIFVKFCY